ncbi:MAG: undecaprenyldiphospho-muramoylpentapeptide beta-N-acetylglucosaminyltransferase [Acidobacteria bacterium]|nr:undecaprenyldiphospho-muramoylpentapeptide beta-N-acetylglucosaminyltransferase [Acidobacteriota bacterium]
MRAVLAGGGTGGHVIPALAIACELQDAHNAEVLFIGTSRGIETRLVPAAGFKLELVEVGALKNVGTATRLATLIALPRAVVRASKLLKGFGADVVIGAGGYASGPAMLAAVVGGIPTLAFESNVVPGLANRIVAPYVGAAAVHFEETARYFPRAVVTGVPVRKEFFNLAPRSAGSPPTLLVFGGSQGASAINRVMTAALPILKSAVPGLSIVHQTGPRDLEQVQAAYRDAGMDAQVSAFIDQMPAAFLAADLLLCRAGASTVAEITAAGKPAIFVPFPRAADDHQQRNAQALERAGAGQIIPEVKLSPEKLAVALAALLKDRSRLAEMSAAARKLAHPDAAQKIAAITVEIAGGNGGHVAEAR